MSGITSLSYDTETSMTVKDILAKRETEDISSVLKQISKITVNTGDSRKLWLKIVKIAQKHT